LPGRTDRASRLRQPAGWKAGVSNLCVLRTHPVTGAKTLYIGNHASHILGMPEAEGEALLIDLLEHATNPQFVYTHRWQDGDLVMWDNRCMLHRALANYEMARPRRVLHRTVVTGTVPF
jgi:alpha-ketoglutarate-dependent taurine dioxygenase